MPSPIRQLYREATLRWIAVGVAALFGAHLLGVATAQAQTPRAVQAVSVSGIVFDSIALQPLPAARVELVNADSVAAQPRIVDTDTLGHFRFADVRPGRYLVGFVHPMLDSIGIASAPRAVTVEGSVADVRVDLALPSSRSLRLAICGATAVGDSSSLIVGVVRDAATRSALASSNVMVEWADLTIALGGLKRSIARRTYDAQETGWFALCGAPAGGTILLSASHGSDSTEALELEIPASGFLRRDLFFGVARAVAVDTADVARFIDSVTRRVGSRRTGDGRLIGTVVAADGGRPLSGARIGIRNGPTTQADQRGAFILTDIPTGTRMLDVRAVSYAPVALPVDVVEGGAPLRIELASLKSVLDTVKVRANLRVNREYEGFLRRQKHGGAGRFITTEDIARRNAIQAVDLLRSMPGILIVRDDNQYEILAQRSPQNFFVPFCRVAVFVNGNPMREPTVSDLNGYLRPNEMLGVEIYDAGAAPAEFSRRNGCGVVVIWTK